jgi:cytosine/uracil/thiamine/allantoin permease
MQQPLSSASELRETTKQSSLYSEDLAPIPFQQRTWNKWNLAALWVGMAVCIPTYMLASYMIKSGLNWDTALIIIGLANLVITLPMIWNGAAGVRYGIPFPVQGRSAFGIKGVHIPSLLRALVACGWFGIQTWIGGLAIYSIFNAITGNQDVAGFSVGEFICFAIFWLINIYFVWKGTEQIKWLENWSAPILILIGLALINWGYQKGASWNDVLVQSNQLKKKSLLLNETLDTLRLNPIIDVDTTSNAKEFRIILPLNSGRTDTTSWQPFDPRAKLIPVRSIVLNGAETVVDITKDIVPKIKAQYRNAEGKTSSIVTAQIHYVKTPSDWFWLYVTWFTAMVGFWATMAISISDITRFAQSQEDQRLGQLLGLPLTMVFYSFVGIFVTCAAVLAFSDIMIADDAPWDPISLISRFNNPWVVVFAQIALLIATLSTNIAANIIAPAYTFSNMFPKTIDFKTGGVIAGIIGIIICPWWLMDSISSILLFVSGLLGPVLGVLLCDYFLIKKQQLELDDLYLHQGIYQYQNGFNKAAMIALIAGIACALIGKWIPDLEFLFSFAWFIGFAVAFVLYYILMRRNINHNVS